LLVEDVPFSVLSETKKRLAEGTPVGVVVNPNALHLFDAESGHRLDLDTQTASAESVPA